MEITNITKALIITHVIFGSITLISGTISLTAKKGKPLHKKSGKVFYYTLFISALLSLVVATMPNHKSPFLFSLGLFSLYFIIGGYRSLKFKKKNISLTLDKIFAYFIVTLGIIMISYSIVLKNKINIVLLNFGAISILFGIVDLFLFRDIKRIHKNWLKIHLLKMTSGYIASVTAFMVNQWSLGILGWFLPTIFGNIYITYWFIKLNKVK
jgi:uncharacterized membrane protein